MTNTSAQQTDWRTVLRRLDAVRWELPITFMPGMRVPGLIFADDTLMAAMATDMAIQQVANVATLPGIVARSIAMPDMHWGYGFPIGGVAATRVRDGVVSPGGVGFDINCGVRLLRTPLRRADVVPRLKQLLDQLFRDVPAGAGQESERRLSAAEEEDVLTHGAAGALRLGYGTPADLELLESRGALPGADPGQVSAQARRRGLGQLGTLGSGNHFLEVQVVGAIDDQAAAQAFGLTEPDQVVVFIHTGSRGLGHQVCQDFLGRMQEAMRRYGIQVPDKQLACAPVESDEGRAYLGAMAAAANFAFANRQAITWAVRRAFARVFGLSDPEAAIAVVYDVAHNIAKRERYMVDGEESELLVHRKGATRAFPAGHAEIPAGYRAVGQPVLVPGDMGRYSYVCVGEGRALEETWGSSCHGAGRMLSRHAATRQLAGVDIAARLRAAGTLVRAQNRSALAEEASEAYKDVRAVVHVLEDAGIARVVAQLWPLGVIKG
jgi:tRNA-splicing ligase RtcB